MTTEDQLREWATEASYRCKFDVLGEEHVNEKRILELITTVRKQQWVIEERETAVKRYFWRQNTPACESCGWANAFYEVQDDLYRAPEKDTATEFAYFTPCGSENSDHLTRHRGAYLFIPRDLFAITVENVGETE